MSLLQSKRPINVSSIALEVRPRFGKPVDNIIFQVGGSTIKISRTLSPGDEHKEVFDHPIELSPQDQVSVSMQFDLDVSRRRGHTLRITMKQNEIVDGLRDDGQGNTRYLRLHKDILVTIVPAASASSPPRNTPPAEASPLISRKGPRDPPLIPTESPQDAPSTTTHTMNQGRRGILSTPTTSTAAIDAPSNLIASESKDPADDTLQPTTDEILRVCPRFRLLVLGNTGVGKSTLIQKVFGVKEVIISEDSRGRADIDREFVAADNGLFVVHDSVGLEAGERNNFDTVKRFISERRKKEDLKDRLHAVWVCLAVPYAKGRLLEAGMEELLRDRKKILGDIPIVVVLTKLDLLDGYLVRALRNEGVNFKTVAEVTPKLESRRTKFIDQYCTQPLFREAGEPIPHMAVSTKSGRGLEGTIPDLVKLTTSEIQRYIKAGLSAAVVKDPASSIQQNAQLYVAEMAQRASDETKVDLSIEIGKKRYWKNLGASFSFSPDKVKKYLFAIHQDIVQIWNFNDPEKALEDDRLKAALLETPDLGVHEIRKVGQVLSGIPMLGSLAAADPTTAIISLPVGGAVALGKILNEIRLASKTIAKLFMAYIVDLVYVMKILFILAPEGAITARDVDLAFQVYQQLRYRSTLHTDIKEFHVNSVIRRDMIMERIEELIRQINITIEEVSRARHQIEAIPSQSS